MITIQDATIYGKFVCWLRGYLPVKSPHKRGVRIQEDGITITLACPRCGITWIRPVAKPKAVSRQEDNPNATRFEGQDEKVI